MKTLPWLLLVGLLSWMLLEEKLGPRLLKGDKEIIQNSVIKRTEELGQLEVVRYHFQEVTEIKKAADRIDLRLFKLPTIVPDTRALLVSQGSATGCIDLTLISAEHISLQNDTVLVVLPPPSLCHFQLDLEKSRLYDLQISHLSQKDQKTFMDELYKIAEADIRRSAMEMGILEEARDNARKILVPLFEDLTGKPVRLRFSLDSPLPYTD